jgi:hypothetical protein
MVLKGDESFRRGWERQHDRAHDLAMLLRSPSDAQVSVSKRTVQFREPPGNWAIRLHRHLRNPQNSQHVLRPSKPNRSLPST